MMNRSEYENTPAPTCSLCNHLEADHRRNGACMAVVARGEESHICPCNGRPAPLPPQEKQAE